MSHRSARLSGAAVIAVAISGFPVGQVLAESVMVKREYVPGRVSYMESRVVLDQEISGLPMPPMKFHVEQLYGLWQKVESATSDKVKIVLTYDRAARKVEAPMMGESEFDTDDPEYEEAAPQLGAVLKPMIGMPITMELSRDGDVLSFSGMDAINKKVSEQAVASMHWEQMKDEFTNQRGEETLGKGPLLIYPDKKVKVGDTWKASSSIDRGPFGIIVTDYQYKVDSIGMENGRKSVLISVTGVVSAGEEAKEDTGSKKEEGTESDPEKAEAKPEPKTEVSGTVSGTAVYDVQLGQVVKRNNDSKVDFRIPLSKLMPNVPAGDEPQFAVFNLTMNAKTSILTEKERNAQKAEARIEAELRRLAEEEDEEEAEEEEDDE